jgi:hypothetical protein
MKKIFDRPGGNFEPCLDAERWCEERGIAIGDMERGQPRGLLLGVFDVAKWHNLSVPERRELDGTMTGDMRHGPVVIELEGDESRYPLIPARVSIEGES